MECHKAQCLDPCFFLVYINDLNKCIRFSTTRHFADDTNLLYNIIMSKIRNRNPTRKLNIDLKSLNQWLLANKISLNATKTELIYFRSKKTKIPESVIKLNGVKLCPTSHVKYVGLTLDEHLTFERHIKLLNAKLKRANNLIAISRHYLTKELILQIYFGQFYSHLTYGCQIWGQNESKLEQTIIFHKKAIRLISFAHHLDHSSPLFKNLKLLKLTDIIKQNNILFVHNVINDKSPNIFKDYFVFDSADHDHNTVNNLNSVYSIPLGSLNVPDYCNNAGKSSIKYICSLSWNSTLKELSIKNIEKYNKNPFWINKLYISNLKHMLKSNFLEHY